MANAIHSPPIRSTEMCFSSCCFLFLVQWKSTAMASGPKSNALTLNGKKPIKKPHRQKKMNATLLHVNGYNSNHCNEYSNKFIKIAKECCTQHMKYTKYELTYNRECDFWLTQKWNGHLLPLSLSLSFYVYFLSMCLIFNCHFEFIDHSDSLPFLLLRLKNGILKPILNNFHFINRFNN